MGESELKDRAKAKVRIMVKGWMVGNIEMQKSLLTLSDALIRGIIDDKTIDLVFKDALIVHIASNSVRREHIYFTSVLWDLIKEVLIEESKALQN